MHANIEDLLALRDGDHNVMQAHVNECIECQTELASLSGIGAQLLSQYDCQPSDLVWSRIQRTLLTESAQAQLNSESLRPSHFQAISRSIYALASVGCRCVCVG